MTQDWSFEYTTHIQYVDGKPAKLGFRVVAADGEVIGDNETYYPTFTEDEAKGRMIAATPKLLAAAKLVDKGAEHHLYCNAGRHGEKSLTCTCYLGAIREAIAEASQGARS